MKHLLLLLSFFSLPLSAQRAIDFNASWSFTHDGKTTCVTLPRAWNEAEAFRVPIEHHSADTVRYTKRFKAPKDWKGKKVFIEFEGARQCAEVWLNGHFLGRHENGVMAFGFDLTPFIKVGKSNCLEVFTNNDWGYRERNYVPDSTDVETQDGNNLPNNTLKPGTFQWNNKNFNANYGGLPKRVRLHVVPTLYQTLPLYSNLATTGTYVYATHIDVPGHSARVHAESEVRNESGRTRTVAFEMELVDRDGTSLGAVRSDYCTLAQGETTTLRVEAPYAGLHFWSWRYGYLYDVRTRLIEAGKTVDEASTRTGFRKTDFGEGQIRLNDRVLMVHGYAQRTSNEWPGVGLSVPEWLSDYSNGLMVESGANLVRWMHVCPWKQDIESCDRVGLLQAMPAGDAEKDVTGRQWTHRLDLMRDAIIYNRNNPSIVFYECGNKGISEDHMRQMKAIRDTYDPHGGRAIGSREMLNVNSCAEYGGEMLYINKSAGKPLWAMEYCRDEGLRRYWDNWSAPYHREGDGPLYRGADASAYNHNMDEFAVEMVRRWYDYWLERPGTGRRVSSGGVKIVFSDTNTHRRGESIYRTSGVVDAMRIPKDAFYAHQVMWNGWVTPDTSLTHIVGHWNYDEATVKPVYVVSDAPLVRLFINDEEMSRGSTSYHFLHTFPNVRFRPGTLRAVSYDVQGRELSSHAIQTAGPAARLRTSVLTRPGGMLADGVDMALVQVELVDADGRRCPLAFDTLHIALRGGIEWIGNEHPVRGNLAQGYDLPLECGILRFLVRSTGHKGSPQLTITSPSGLTAQCAISTTNTLSSHPSLSAFSSQLSAQSSLSAFSSPLSANSLSSHPSLSDFSSVPELVEGQLSAKSLSAKSVTAGCNNDEAWRSIDDSEDTEWKNDGRLSTAWITYEFDRPSQIDELVLKLTGWRKRQYPLKIYADSLLVWEGKTPVSLGYVHLPLRPAPPCSRITIRLKGSASDSDQFEGIKELAAPVANELDLFKAKDGDKVNNELRIVEIEFLKTGCAD